MRLVFVSDDLNHTKYSVYVYIQYIFNHLKTTYPDIEYINIFSDGATSQFKQRFLFSNLYAWEMEYGFTITWNFFATSHGKGVVDGIGGTVKRAIWRHVKAERAHVTNASLFDRINTIYVRISLEQSVYQERFKLHYSSLWGPRDGTL